MTTTYDIHRQPPTLLFALDIDGTLVTEGTMDISQAVRDAVAAVCVAGHHVVVATGRSLVGALPVAKDLGLTSGWIVASNGAVTAQLDPTAPNGYRLHDVRTFDPAPVVRCARSAFPGARVATEVLGVGYRVNHLFSTHELNGAQELGSVAKAIDRHTTRLILSAPGITGLIGKLAALGVTVTPGGSNLLDVTPHRLSKATALEVVRTQLGVQSRHTVAVGDGLNDLEMLAWARNGVAMGHAPAKVRAAADAVTGTLEEHGAAAVLRSLLLETIPAGR